MEIGDFYKEKDILVTCGCGSIGREIVKHLLNYNPKKSVFLTKMSLPIIS